MNKKHLSVVMAGAMLATSVAPVLAADRTVNDSNKGLLIEELRNKILSKSYTDLQSNVIAANKLPANPSKVQELDEDGVSKSVYVVETVAPAIKGITVNKIGNGVNRPYKYLLDAIEDSVKGVGMDCPRLNPSNVTASKKNRRAKVNLTIEANGLDYVIKVETNTNNLDAVDIANAKALKVTFIPKTLDVYDEDDIDTGAMESALQNAVKGTTVRVWNRGVMENNGKVYNHYIATDEKDALKYDDASLRKVERDFDAGRLSDVVSDADYREGTLTVSLRKAGGETVYIDDIVLKAGDTQLDFTKALDKDGEVISEDPNDWTNFHHFGYKYDDSRKIGDNIPRTLVETIEIGDSATSTGIALSEVYDGLFLTANGEKLLAAMDDYDAKEDAHNNGKLDSYYHVEDVDSSKIVKDGRGLYNLNIVFEKQLIVNGQYGKLVKEVVTITTNNQAQLKVFADGIAKDYINNTTNKYERRFPAQILAGDNRYETAVKVAKENADIDTVAKNGNIVLVNGNALVDGLAAAPLAASVCNLHNSKNFVAPILLTDANGIPKETKAYMKELIGRQKVKNLKKVTVYLVGGEAVISPAVENDLKEIGFRVMRAGGKDREETSVEVAKMMNNREVANDVNEEAAFLVGADGEADAMSVASVAAATKTPILVESRHGLKEESLNFFKKYKKDHQKFKDVVIIGGENVVSKNTADFVADHKLNVERIAGSNRQRTNAKVIESFYGMHGTFRGHVELVNPGHRFDNVVVSKDGQRNKSELIDALTATSLATKHNAPIVLGTNKLAKEQINVLELNANRTNGIYVYQVGNGVARDVVKTIAERIGLAAK